MQVQRAHTDGSPSSSVSPKSPGDALSRLSIAVPGSPVDGDSSNRSDTRRKSSALELLDDTSGRSRRSLTNAKAFMPERVNAEISKRYDIEKHEIGSGCFGKVYIAEDREMPGRMAAIKRVVVGDAERKKAFAREVTIMKELDHPNICKLLETYEQGRFMFFVMEWCEGGEVFDRIMNEGMIEEPKAAEIVRQCASALMYAHSKGIAHRDMKPENICFCSPDPEDHHIKVIDWGLGFYFGEARMTSAVGSLSYAAPEVLEEREVDTGYSCSCDIWSLGVVAYMMLCGEPPFGRGQYMEQLRRMKDEEIEMSDPVWEDVSDDAKLLIRSLLRANPEDRLPLSKALLNPWLRTKALPTDAAVSREVLHNMRRFSKTSQFFSLCVASVARQLDHRSLTDVHSVFSEMDTNGDGVLELHEVRAGFEKIYGKESEIVQEVEAMFQRLDMDGSGTIDYTEFCAAGIGEKVSTEENVLWAAFKAFDCEDDDGKVTKDEIINVLKSASVDDCWTDEVCDELAAELMSRFDTDGDGTLDFDEWTRLMKEISSNKVHDMLLGSQDMSTLRSNASNGGPLASPNPAIVLQKLEASDAAAAKLEEASDAAVAGTPLVAAAGGFAPLNIQKASNTTPCCTGCEVM